jgi:hypothetical protein
MKPKKHDASPSYHGIVVNGYARDGGLEFSREVWSREEHDGAVAAAWKTGHVVRVTTEWRCA